MDYDWASSASETVSVRLGWSACTPEIPAPANQPSPAENNTVSNSKEINLKLLKNNIVSKDFDKLYRFWLRNVLGHEIYSK